MTERMKVVVTPASPDQLHVVQEVLRNSAVDCLLICEPADCRLAPMCRWLGPSSVNREGLLAGALVDAIRTLEQTRHAFKSKQLGELRRRLQQLLESLPDN